MERKMKFLAVVSSSTTTKSMLAYQHTCCSAHSFWTQVISNVMLQAADERCPIAFRVDAWTRGAAPMWEEWEVYSWGGCFKSNVFYRQSNTTYREPGNRPDWLSSNSKLQCGANRTCEGGNFSGYERTQPSFWWLAHVDGVQYHAQGHSAMQPVDPGHRPLKLPISGWPASTFSWLIWLQVDDAINLFYHPAAEVCTRHVRLKRLSWWS